jgi:hypothetical protein
MNSSIIPCRSTSAWRFRSQDQPDRAFGHDPLDRREHRPRRLGHALPVRRYRVGGETTPCSTPYSMHKPRIWFPIDHRAPLTGERPELFSIRIGAGVPINPTMIATILMQIRSNILAVQRLAAGAPEA